MKVSMTADVKVIKTNEKEVVLCVNGQHLTLCKGDSVTIDFNATG